MTAPGARDRAIHRLDILSRQLERVGAGDLRRVVTDPRTPERGLLRIAAQDAVESAGLGDLLDEARSRFRTWTERVLRAGGYAPIATAMWGRVGSSVEDQVAIARTVDDAVVATVAHELIPDLDRRALMEPFDRMLELRPPVRHARDGDSG